MAGEGNPRHTGAAGRRAFWHSLRDRLARGSLGDGSLCEAKLRKRPSLGVELAATCNPWMCEQLGRCRCALGGKDRLQQVPGPGRVVCVNEAMALGQHLLQLVLATKTAMPEHPIRAQVCGEQAHQDHTDGPDASRLCGGLHSATHGAGLPVLVDGRCMGHLRSVQAVAGMAQQRCQALKVDELHRGAGNDQILRLDIIVEILDTKTVILVVPVRTCRTSGGLRDRRSSPLQHPARRGRRHQPCARLRRSHCRRHCPRHAEVEADLTGEGVALGDAHHARHATRCATGARAELLRGEELGEQVGQLSEQEQGRRLVEGARPVFLRVPQIRSELPLVAKLHEDTAKSALNALAAYLPDDGCVAEDPYDPHDVVRGSQASLGGQPSLNLRQLLQHTPLELSYREAAHLLALALAVKRLYTQRQLLQPELILDYPHTPHGAPVDVPCHREAAPNFGA
mmetsp:Transcript_102828/g.296108  ORF Transcript_102828/g.296108 Transcript_102828/m.296108 type:complete len:454 (-) Transcript_102828:433-1794(-)